MDGLTETGETPVVVIDRRGSVTRINAAAASLFGVTGEPPPDCDPPSFGRWIDDPAFGMALDRLVRRSGGATTASPLHLKRHAGPMAATLLPPRKGRDGSDDGGAAILLTPLLNRRSAPLAGPLRLTAVVALCVAAAAWAALSPSASTVTATPVSATDPTPSAEAIPAEAIPAMPPPRLSVVGVIEPTRTVNVIAPFAGTVKERRFDYGAHVVRGEPLLILDGRDLEMRMRDAESALLKAGQRLDELRNWPNSADVSRARRQVVTAEREAEQAQQRFRDAEPLIERGIIPRQEYDDLRRQAATQAANLAAAREDLAVALRKGDQDAQRVAELEFANAEAKVGELKALFDRAAVTAPVSGLALKPPAGASTGQSAATAIEAGGALTANQIIAVLADLERLSVTARVDEMDVGRISIGQSVEVSGDALADGPMTGVVGWVAQQATASENGAPTASFAIRVDLPPLTEAQRRNVRVGMSANLSIDAPAAAATVAAPADAMRHAEADATRLK